MIDSLMSLYTLLSSNPIAMSLIITPLLSGVVFLFVKRVPSSLFRIIVSRFTTVTTIYQAVDGEAFRIGEYLLARYKFTSFINNFIVRKLVFSEDPVFLSGNYTTFYAFIDGIFVTAYRHSDEQSKLDHRFILTFCFFTKKKKAIKKIFAKAYQEMETSILDNNIRIYTSDKWGGEWQFRTKQKKHHIPRTKAQREALDRILAYIERPDFEKLGIILQGLPGCGKTDLIEQLVTVTGYKLYYLNLSTMDDGRFLNMMNNVTTPSIVLIEDIDCFSVTHSRKNTQKVKLTDDTEETKEEKAETSTEITVHKNEYGTLSLSTILNVFDGILSIERQIIIATTNHLDALDPALRRKGRFDMTIELVPMVRDEIIKYVADYYDVLVEEVDAYDKSLQVYREDLSLPIAAVASTCKEHTDYKTAIFTIHGEDIFTRIGR